MFEFNTTRSRESDYDDTLVRKGILSGGRFRRSERRYRSVNRENRLPFLTSSPTFSLERCLEWIHLAALIFLMKSRVATPFTQIKRYTNSTFCLTVKVRFRGRDRRSRKNWLRLPTSPPVRRTAERTRLPTGFPSRRLRVPLRRPLRLRS